MSDERIEQLRTRLKADPANEDRVELARLLTDKPDARAEARELCFAALANEPNNIRCRVILARLFYLDHYTEFAIREVVEACRRRPAQSLYRLIDGFGNAAARYAVALAGSLDIPPAGTAMSAAAQSRISEEDAEVAEIEIDGELMDILDELSSDDPDGSGKDD